MSITYGHVHTGLASARFDSSDAVTVTTIRGTEWAVYLDESLPRWEVFIDATNGRVFVSRATWDSLDGKARVAFEDDFMLAYTGTDKVELRQLTDEVYQAGARRRAALEGTAHVAPGDRITELQRRADEAVAAAAGINGAPSVLQLQVFAVRHAQLSEDLAALEADMARLRAAVEVSGSALQRAFG